jgi:hypothetical protein
MTKSTILRTLNAVVTATTGGFLALFSPLSHHPCHSEENTGNHKQKDCRNQLYQHINLL